MLEKDYLTIGRATEIADPKERRFYRFLEMLPGILSWTTIFLVVFLSWATPVFVAIFIIAFDVYWLFKTIFLSLHMRSSFRKMKANMRKNWVEELGKVEIGSEVLEKTDWRDIYHLVILPFYKEPIDVVKMGLESLSKINYPLEKLIVVLAAEEQAGEQAKAIAESIERGFGNRFFKFITTFHPAGISGELAGKGSNETFAAKIAKAEIIDKLEIPYERVVVSVFDIDTVVHPEFFGCLTYNYLAAKNPLRSSFQPIPLFTNNIWQASAISRIFSFNTTFWQMIQQSRPERLITFSSQSIGFKPLAELGFWQTNIVSEDSRIFWQCLLRFDGDWRTVPMFFPIYMDANIGKNFVETTKNLYKQIQRWAYGVENNSYFLYGFSKNKKIPRSKKWYFGFNMIEGAHSLATNSLIIFMLGWLPTIIGRGGFSETLLSYNLPYITRTIMTVAMIGMVFTAILSINILPSRPSHFGRHRYVWMVLQWILFPINMIFFGSIPSLDAQTRLMFGKYMGFWNTPKSR